MGSQDGVTMKLQEVERSFVLADDGSSHFDNLSLNAPGTIHHVAVRLGGSAPATPGSVILQAFAFGGVSTQLFPLTPPGRVGDFPHGDVSGPRHGPFPYDKEHQVFYGGVNRSGANVTVNLTLTVEVNRR